MAEILRHSAMQFWGGQRNILRVILETGMFLHDSIVLMVAVLPWSGASSRP